MAGCARREKADSAQAVLIGYYCAYYMNSGRKAESPNKIIKKLFAEKQSEEEGLAEIRRVKAAEERRLNGNQHNKSVTDNQ